MNTTVIKIKLSHSRLQLLPDVMLNFLDFELIVSESVQNSHKKISEDKQITASIAAELVRHFNKQLEKRSPAETHSFKLEVHHAIIFQRALLYNITETKDDFKRNAYEIIKNELNQKVVSISSVRNWGNDA
ncbi:hypothetical protein [Cochleicola gelatinilyticus]|uniref:Uncharacterized protein n=1 Tax=Cochleicola gelatinilyticus TaxID=1763537 RepID=A0A167IK26_9FLAO|nr:hypothetical protein [Cochleicola gelatinilyticus]OAB79736.1 hypothetical protein ULVI_03045 [Cochleicola gelatinilyticus]